MYKIVVGAFVLLGVVIGYLWSVSSDAIIIETKLVSKEDVAKLVKCIVADNCAIPRTSIVSKGHQFSAVTVATNEGVQIRYLVGEQNSILIMLTMNGEPVLIEDDGYTGVVRRVTELFDGKPLTLEAGQEGFEILFPDAQDIYVRAMEQAKRYIIPRDHSVGA